MTAASILVCTHDRYQAAWPIFAHGLTRYWPDRPWPVKAITNRLAFPIGEGLRVGGDRDWSENMRRGLMAIDADVILLLLDDTWLTEMVDTAALVDFAGHVAAGRTDYIRLVRTAGQQDGEPAPFDARLFRPGPLSTYRTAICPTLWRTDVLLGLIRTGDTVHGFELRNDPGDAIYHCVRAWDSYLPHVFPTRDAAWRWSPIQQGRWTDGAREYVRRERLGIDLVGDYVAV